MALQVFLDYDLARETATGDGWRVIKIDSATSPPVEVTTYHTTIDLAATTIKGYFSDDPVVDQYFLDRAEANLLAANAAALATSKASLRTAEGIDAAP